MIFLNKLVKSHLISTSYQTAFFSSLPQYIVVIIINILYIYHCYPFGSLQLLYPLIVNYSYYTLPGSYIMCLNIILLYQYFHSYFIFSICKMFIVCMTKFMCNDLSRDKNEITRKWRLYDSEVRVNFELQKVL